jgi:hypothetical protein
MAEETTPERKIMVATLDDVLEAYKAWFVEQGADEQQATTLSEYFRQFAHSNSPKARKLFVEASK